jgi:hypothetical protein
MSAVLLHRFLGLCLLLAALAFLVATVLALALPTVGERLLTTWPVVIDTPRVVQVSDGPAPTALVIERGTLRSESSNPRHGLWRLLDVAVVGSLVLVLLEALRRMVGDLRCSRPFGAAAERRLRISAACLAGLALWSAMSPLVWSAWLLQPGPSAQFERSGWLTFTLSSGERWYIWPDVAWGLVVAALICLLLGRVFAIGAELQRDSDEII